jgi:hypothetical protein
MDIRKIILFPKLTLLIIAIITLSWIPVNSVSEHSLEINQESAVITPIELLGREASTIYENIKLADVGLSFNVFEQAYIGFLNLKNSNKISEEASVLSIADFDKSSKTKRLWIVDLNKDSLLLNTWVSHGRGSGNEMATKFSNINNSYQSSLGFYVTGEVYHGKHGRSLRLDGMDKGFNDNARSRAIVLHGAQYVSSQAIKSLNRLGLSHGCPAVPLELTDQIIDLIKEKTVLYIYANSPIYQSVYLDSLEAGKRLLAYSDLSSNFQVGI